MNLSRLTDIKLIVFLRSRFLVTFSFEHESPQFAEQPYVNDSDTRKEDVDINLMQLEPPQVLAR